MDEFRFHFPVGDIPVMPIRIDADVRRPTPDEFTSLAYDVMACAFQVHNEIGRFFDEKIYKRLLARRFGNVELEVPVVVSHGDFAKRYSIDMLVRGAAIFEWKAVECLADQHRAQLLNYLLLCDLPKGKLLNVRPELIDHEFVNTTLRPEDRRKHRVDDHAFTPLDDRDRAWKEFLLLAIEDWGTGLDVLLYTSAISHFFGGDEKVVQAIKIVTGGETIGAQYARLTASNAAFKVTALSEHESGFEKHARKFLALTTLSAVHWININRQCVALKTLLPDGAFKTGKSRTGK